MNFGSLTLNAPSVKKVNCNSEALDYLFSSSKKLLDKLTVIEAENRIALENLDKLTKELQTKRLRYNAKAACKYFTL